MIKTKIVETTEKYDKDGTLIEKITREETTEDDEARYPVVTLATNPNTPTPWWQGPYYCGTDISCATSASTNANDCK